MITHYDYQNQKNCPLAGGGAGIAELAFILVVSGLGISRAVSDATYMDVSASAYIVSLHASLPGVICHKLPLVAAPPAFVFICRGLVCLLGWFCYSYGM